MSTRVSTLLLEVQQTPHNVDTLRELHQAAKEERRLVVERLAAGVLCLFDERVAPPQSFTIGEAVEPERIGRLLYPPEHARWMRIGALLWANAASLRQTLTSFGLQPSDRLRGVNVPLNIGRPFLNAMNVLGHQEVPLYLSKQGETLALLRTDPISLAIGEHAGPNEGALKFRIGRALELSRPGHVFLATLPYDHSELLFQSAAAAFSARTGSQHIEPVSGEIAKEAANWWNVVPAETQRDLRDEWKQLDPNGFCDFFERAQRSALLGGLICAGSLQPAVEALMYDDPSLQEESYVSEQSFEHAVTQSAALATIIELAFSPEFIQLARAAIRHKQ